MQVSMASAHQIGSTASGWSLLLDRARLPPALYSEAGRLLLLLNNFVFLDRAHHQQLARLFGHIARANEIP